MKDADLYRTPPRIRYQTDPEFHYLVDHMHAMIQRAQFSPSELREAAILAAIMYEERRAHCYRMGSDGHIEELEPRVPAPAGETKGGGG